jgi:PAS domain S-box-containing protein
MKKLPIVPSLISIFILFTFGVISFFVREGIQSSANDALQSKISSEVQSITVYSKQLLSEYTGVLRSTKALFYASDEVTRSDWHDYVYSLNLKKNYPSITAIDFIKRVERSDKDKYEASINNDSFFKNTSDQEFEIKPITKTEDFYVVHYIEPIEGNEVAVGYNLYSDDIRKKALELARDTNSLIITEPITLVQEKESQKAFLMVLPVYKNNQAVETLADRQQYVEGFVLLVIRSGDFFSQVIASNALTNITSFKVSDVDIYDSSFLVGINSEGESPSTLDFIGDSHVISRLNIGARNWQYEFYVNSVEANLVGVASYIPVMILLLGIIISILVWLIIFNSRKLQSKAEEIAEKLTGDLQKFKLAIENVSDQIIIADNDSKIIYFNKETEDVVGQNHSHFFGKDIRELLGSLVSNHTEEEMKKVIREDKSTFEGETVSKDKNGEDYVSQIKVSPVLDKKNDILFFVLVKRDITKEKRIDKMKTDFIKVASHQLRTPLSAMRWHLEIFLSNDVKNLNEEQSELVKKIYKSNKRIISLVNGLINISKIESGEIPISPKVVNINDLIKSVIEEFSDKVSERNMQISLDVSDSLGEVSLDKDLVSDVYRNMIANSIKYSLDGTDISIKITQDGDNMLSEISDSGLGIPEKDKENIFKKFYRGSNAVDTETDGSGLGLYLAKSVIESSGGKVWFESEQKKGTTFWFTLPIKGIK